MNMPVNMEQWQVNGDVFDLYSTFIRDDVISVEIICSENLRKAEKRSKYNNIWMDSFDGKDYSFLMGWFDQQSKSPNK